MKKGVKEIKEEKMWMMKNEMEKKDNEGDE